ncbi:MAG: DUF58 domain-containing protein [Thermodesulfobacteriota bacterium]
MLSPDIIRKIKKVHIKSARSVDAAMAGHYRSLFRGVGIEFEEVREYAPGDEVKSIDWKVSARLGRPFIKRYREERERVVMLLVDMSASGKFGTGEALKQEIAAETAGVLAFNAVRSNDTVGAIFFTDRVEKYLPPQKGTAHVWQVIREVFSFEPEGVGTDIREALAFLGRVCRRRAVTFLISDFLDDGYHRELKTLAQRHELIGVRLFDPGEFELPAGGMLHVQDLETGEWVWIDAGNGRTRAAWREAREAAVRRAEETLRSAGAPWLSIRTGEEAADALNRFFRTRGRRRR